MAWFRTQSAVNHRAFRPEDLKYPFVFPVIVLQDNAVSGFLTPQHFGLAGEDTARTGSVPGREIFTDAMECWKPIRVRSVCNAGAKVFGRSVYYGEFEYALERTYELAELRGRIIACVEADPDDIWNQIMEHDDVIRAVRSASSFAELVQALREAGAAS